MDNKKMTMPVYPRRWPGSRTGLVVAGWLVAPATVAGLLAAQIIGRANPSTLLEAVDNNPGMAESLCARFVAQNQQGTSAYSDQSINAVAAAQGISAEDAEILVTYVAGLNCPDVD